MDEINSAIHRAVDLCVPLQRIRVGQRKEQPPWMNKSILNYIEMHRAAYAVFRRRKTQKNRKAANRLKALKRRAIKDAKAAYIRSIVFEAEERRSLWEIHRRLSGKRKRGIPALAVDGEILQEDSRKAEALASCFSAAFEVEDVEGEELIQSLLSSPAEPVPVEELLGPVAVKKELDSLNKRKAVGLDGIPPMALRALSSSIAAPLALLINIILTTQVVPSAWKRSWISPVPKVPAPTSPSHFRPISILDSMAKILDKIIVRALLRCGIRPHRRQFGFSPGSSCGDAFLVLQSDILRLCREGSRTAVTVVSLDCQRAFDKVKHSALLRALRNRSVPRWLLRLIANWLQNREFQVRVGEAGRSGWKRVTSGAPQGAGLSAILFRTAIDGVFSLELNESTRLLLYADDLLLLARSETLEDCRKIQQDLDKITDFLAQLGLSLNVGKCKALNISLDPRGHQLPCPLFVNQVEIPLCQELRYLGVTLDPRLNFSLHWDRVAASTKAAVGALSRLVSGHSKALAFLYNQQIVSRLLHSLPYVPPSTQRSWARLNGVTSFCAHLCLNRWDLHGLEITRKAGLTPPSEICFIQGLRYLYKCIYGGQRYGVWIREGEGLIEARESRRSERLKLREQRPSWFLSPPDTHLQPWKQLQPVRLVLTLNSLPFHQAKLDPKAAMKTLRAFTASLPLLYSHLDPVLKKSHFGEF